MIIGKGKTEKTIVCTEVDFGRDTVLTGNLMVPTKEYIGYNIRLKNYRIYKRFDGFQECRCTRLFPYENYCVRWGDRIYHVDSPEKFWALANLIMTEFYIMRLE